MEKLKKLYRKWCAASLANRLWCLGIMCLILGVEGRNFIRAYSGHSTRVIAAKRNLVKGSVINIEDLTVAMVPTEEKNRYFSDQEVHLLIGAQVVRDCIENKPILFSQVRQALPKSFSGKIPYGLRAYSIQIPHDLPLEVGDHVDVLGGGRGDEDRLLVESREILTTQKKETHQQVFLAVSLEEAKKLDAIGEEENLKVILRNPKDVSYKTKNVAKKHRLRSQKIEILSEG